MSAPASSPSVSVVVPAYRRPHLLPRLVAALEAQALPVDQFEVLIVDDCSGDGTGEVLADLAGRSSLTLRLLTTRVNGGPAVARNLGWRAARGPYVAFTDDDCVPRPDWLDQGLRTCQATPRLGVLQGATVLPREHPPRGPLSVYREILEPSPYFEGCNLFFPRKVLEETGGFDETFPLAGEDTVAGWRALEGDREWVFDETAVVAHDVTERPLRWHLMMAYREGNMVDVARRHPEFRKTFWRPWAHRRSNVAFVPGAVGLVAAIRWRPAVLATLPWLSMRCPPLTQHGALPTFAFRLVNDAAVCAGMVVASVRNRTLVL